MRCELVIREPPADTAPIELRALLLYGLPIAFVLFALLIPALHR